MLQGGSLHLDARPSTLSQVAPLGYLESLGVVNSLHPTASSSVRPSPGCVDDEDVFLTPRSEVPLVLYPGSA